MTGEWAGEHEREEMQDRESARESVCVCAKEIYEALEFLSIFFENLVS